MNELGWLVNYYVRCCNKDWEHNYGIKIDTLDNPGWSLEINLTDTKLEHVDFIEVKEERSENDWVWCAVKSGDFLGYGGPKNLAELINIFRKWAETIHANNQ